MLLVEEFEHEGCQVEFVDRPMSQDPHDQLLLQIRGAVAEYERSLIAERMRRGRRQKYQVGSLLPGLVRLMAIEWTPAVLVIPQECAWSHLAPRDAQRYVPSAELALQAHSILLLISGSGIGNASTLWKEESNEERSQACLLMR